jgi:hypothetical protein
MNNNDIDNLLIEAKNKIKKIHNKAILQIKQELSINPLAHEDIQNKLTSMITHHNNLLNILKNKYSPKKVKIYIDKITSLKNKLGETTQNTINNSTNANKMLIDLKKIVTSKLESSPRYVLSKTYIKNKIKSLSPKFKIAAKTLNDLNKKAISELQNSPRYFLSKTYINNNVKSTSPKSEMAHEILKDLKKELASKLENTPKYIASKKYIENKIKKLTPKFKMANQIIKEKINELKQSEEIKIVYTNIIKRLDDIHDSIISKLKDNDVILNNFRIESKRILYDISKASKITLENILNKIKRKNSISSPKKYINKINNNIEEKKIKKIKALLISNKTLS